MMLGISSKRLTIFENRLHHSPARIYLLKVNVRTLEQGVRHVQISHLILAFLLLTLNMLLLAGRCWTLSKILLCNSVSNRILSIEPCQSGCVIPTRDCRYLAEGHITIGGWRVQPSSWMTGCYPRRYPVLFF